MLIKNKWLLIVFYILLLINPLTLSAKESQLTAMTKEVKLNYVSPVELEVALKANNLLDDKNILIKNNGSVHFIFNNSTNQIMLTGDSLSIAEAIQIIAFLDVPPRQIIIEAKMIEVDNQRINQIGIDWQYLLDKVKVGPYYDIQESRYEQDLSHEKSVSKRYGFNIDMPITVGDLLKIIQETGIGRIVSIPQIVTTNNKEGTILDGDRITYVTRYSSYANIFETQEMTAGLSLSVTPSLGESGYMKLIVNAKVTSLGQLISGSPSESGQIIENTVVVKSGEEFLLGGFKKTEKSKFKRKIPILGTILPFLFSRTVEMEIVKDFLIVLKPTVIDLKSPEIPKLE